MCKVLNKAFLLQSLCHCLAECLAGSFGLCAEALLYLDRCADEFELHLCFVPLRNLLHNLASPCERAEDAEVMVLDAASGEFGEQHLHSRIDTVVICNSSATAS